MTAPPPVLAAVTLRAAFEVVLILGYLVLVLGQRAPLPLPWRRRRE